MSDMKDYLWLVKTDKGDFFITVIGHWTQEEAAKKVQMMFEKIKLGITAMIPGDAMGTIYQKEKSENGLGFEFLGGKKLWQVCGRGAEYEAERIRLKKEVET